LARDGEVVANLIEDAFGLKNDPDGQSVLIQMRENARRLKHASWIPLSGSALGFVWRLTVGWWETYRFCPSLTTLAGFICLLMWQ
jgi:hypothetical protein